MKLTSTVGGALAAPPRSTMLEKSAPTGSLAAAVVAPDVAVGAQVEQLQSAHVQLADLPAVDAQRVAEIKQALARGEIQFDAKKLAGLIVRHHGGRG